MEIKRITEENAGDLRLHNDPFAMPGRLIPELKDGAWRYRTEPFEEVQTMVFPEEDYEYASVAKDGTAFAAYENGQCVGLIVLKNAFFRYMYVYDLKVSASARRTGAGRALLEAAKQEAIDRGYLGLYLQAQDNNLGACLFYLNNGFVIGGFDNRVYHGTGQQGKADIILYWDQTTE